MSERWMTYTSNNQLIDNSDYQEYLLELAVLITKTLIIHWNHINMVLRGDSLSHSKMQYTVAWTGNYPANISLSCSIYK